MKNHNTSVVGGMFSALSQLKIQRVEVNMLELVSEARCSSVGDPVPYARISWVFAHKDSCITAFIAAIKVPTKNGIGTKIVTMNNSGKIEHSWLDRSKNPKVIFDTCGGIFARGVILAAEDEETGETCHSFSVRKGEKLQAMHHRPVLITRHETAGYPTFMGIDVFSEEKICVEWEKGDYSGSSFVSEALDVASHGNDTGVFEYVNACIREEQEKRKPKKDATQQIEEAMGLSEKLGEQIMGELPKPPEKSE
jgi:hypothetical protein